MAGVMLKAGLKLARFFVVMNYPRDADIMPLYCRYYTDTMRLKYA